MKLKILDFGEALKYVPEEKSYSIRIITEFNDPFIRNLKESENWVGDKKYYFDDVWPMEWDEHFWYNPKCKDFQKYLKEQKKKYPKMTEKSLLGYLESQGHPQGRYNLFNEGLANKILGDFEKVMGDVESVIISSSDGKHRTAGIGIAMNSIYSWGINGLTGRYFGYRKYVCQTMMDAAKKR